MSTALQTALPTGTWGTDKTHSTASFAIKYMVSTFRSEFSDVDVQLDTTGDEPKLTGSVGPDSIQVKDENFHAHLQGPDFFDTENNPRVTFESTGFRADGEELVVNGNLTIKGDTRPIEARGTLTPAHEDPWGNTRLGITLDASIDRTHFGITWNNPLPKGGLALADEVKLHVDLQLVKS
jgi:polyisoprenoid-binding protein YceI